MPQSESPDGSTDVAQAAESTTGAANPGSSLAKTAHYRHRYRQARAGGRAAAAYRPGIAPPPLLGNSPAHPLSAAPADPANRSHQRPTEEHRMDRAGPRCAR